MQLETPARTKRERRMGYQAWDRTACVYCPPTAALQPIAKRARPEHGSMSRKPAKSNCNVCRAFHETVAFGMAQLHDNSGRTSCRTPHQSRLILRWFTPMTAVNRRFHSRRRSMSVMAMLHQQCPGPGSECRKNVAQVVLTSCVPQKIRLGRALLTLNSLLRGDP